MTNLDDARRAYEAAKALTDWHDKSSVLHDAARILLTNASQDYAQALVDDAQRKLDDMGVVIGETMVESTRCDGFICSPIARLEADIEKGCVKAWLSRLTSFIRIDDIRPYVAPVVKEMVFEG